MIKDYLTEVHSTKAETTSLSHTKVLKSWFPTGVQNLEPAYVVAKLDEWRKAGIAQNTLVTRLNVLHQLIRYIEDKQDVPKVKDLRRIIKAVQPQKKIAAHATAAQAHDIISGINDPKYQALIAVLFYGGLRVSEAVGLDLADIKPGWQLHIHDTKNKEDRMIGLHKNAAKIVQLYIDKYRLPTSDALFTTHNGRISINVVQRMVAKFSHEAGADLTPHAFRHGAGTHLMEQGVNLRLIQDFLGHKSITTTQRYTHVSAEQRSRVTAAYDNAKNEEQRPKGQLGLFEGQ